MHSRQLQDVVPCVRKYISTTAASPEKGIKIDDSFFIIAGSFPASMVAQEHDINLRYNDIDVYVSAVETSEDTSSNLLEVWRADNVVSGIQINLILMKELAFDQLLDSFDTNCVRVGFQATFDRNDAELRWDNTRPEFRDFLENRILRIHDIGALTSPAAAFIRLLYKSQQLALPFQLPSERELKEAVSFRCFGGSNIDKFKGLSPELQMEVTQRFSLKQCFCYRYNTQICRLEPRVLTYPREFARAQDVNVNALTEYELTFHNPCATKPPKFVDKYAQYESKSLEHPRGFSHDQWTDYDVSSLKGFGKLQEDSFMLYAANDMASASFGIMEDFLAYDLSFVETFVFYSLFRT